MKSCARGARSTPPKTPAPGSAQDWLRHARSDLALARGGRSGLILREHLCFHAQQAVEKALKAVLLTFHTPLPRTHDVGHLLTLLPPTLPQPAAVRQAGVLTKYAVQAAILPIGMKSLRAIMRRP